MKLLTREEIKKTQMDALDALVAFCTQHSIRVSIASGTLIGAVRHKGYIPWDDDIDVFIPREDYMQLEKLFPSLYRDNYRLESIYRNEKWHEPFAKLCDIRTVEYIDSRRTTPYGVFVDIFPIDDVPDDDREFRKYMRKLGLLRFLFNDTRKTTVQMGIIKKIEITIHHYFISLFPHKLLMEIREKYNQIHNNKGYKRCYANTYGPLQPNPFPKSMFNDIKMWQFEDRNVPGFRDADKFLTLQYGDYMKLPPEEKRIHHSEVAYWKDTK